MQTIQAKDISLFDLKSRFNLAQTKDESFFWEWQNNLPEVSELEKNALDRVRSNYENLTQRRPMSEEAVKMVVLSPLLDLAGFYQPPFEIETEASTEILAEDEGVLLKGRIDVLVIQRQFWVLVIESKSTKFAVLAGQPQVLTYMLGKPRPEKPGFGLLTNGDDFIFVKLIQQSTPQYGLSRVFSLANPGNDLYGILAVLKVIGGLIQN